MYLYNISYISGMEACIMDDLKILVVDDESRMRQLVKDFLRKNN